MPLIHVSSSRLIPAAPNRVYAIIADYQTGHPQILPSRYFSNLQVEQGGIGAGTVIRFQMHAFGSTQTIRAEITEPIPSELLLETIAATGLQTSFHVVPQSDGKASHVTIETKWDVKGLAGWIQSLMVPRYLRKVYAEELDKLASVATTGT